MVTWVNEACCYDDLARIALHGHPPNFEFIENVCFDECSQCGKSMIGIRVKGSNVEKTFDPNMVTRQRRQDEDQTGQ